MHPTQYFTHHCVHLSARALKFEQYVISMVWGFFGDTLYIHVSAFRKIQRALIIHLVACEQAFIQVGPVFPAWINARSQAMHLVAPVPALSFFQTVPILYLYGFPQTFFCHIYPYASIYKVTKLQVTFIDCN